MKKYILNGIKLTQGEGEDYEELYYSDELDDSISEQDLIKLGATEVKDDGWEALKKVSETFTSSNSVDNAKAINQLIKNQQYLKSKLDELDTNKQTS